jgi:hypothetical protein
MNEVIAVNKSLDTDEIRHAKVYTTDRKLVQKFKMNRDMYLWLKKNDYIHVKKYRYEKKVSQTPPNKPKETSKKG